MRSDFDLQSHSLYSDGALAPRAVVTCAEKAGVELLALTDHDTVGGVDEADGCDAVLAAIERFLPFGLDGVECFYPTHTREQTELLHDRCMALDLLATGSSDFHGPAHRLFSLFRSFSTYGRTPLLGPLR